MSAALREATDALEAYRFDDYAAAGYRFVWNTYCDWFLEFAKPALGNASQGVAETADAPEVRATAAHVLGVLLRLLHPAMPYVTEELWDHFSYGAACTSTNGGHRSTKTGPTSPLLVTGLTNGRTYTCTVAARRYNVAEIEFSTGPSAGCVAGGGEVATANDAAKAAASAPNRKTVNKSKSPSGRIQQRE